MCTFGHLEQPTVGGASAVLADRLGNDAAGRIGRDMDNLATGILVLAAIITNLLTTIISVPVTTVPAPPMVKARSIHIRVRSPVRGGTFASAARRASTISLRVPMSRCTAFDAANSRSRCRSRWGNRPWWRRTPSQTPSPSMNPLSKTDTTARSRGTISSLTPMRVSALRGSAAWSCVGHRPCQQPPRHRDRVGGPLHGLGRYRGRWSELGQYCGQPWPRPPYPAVEGLWRQPSNVNNVKSYGYATHIIRKGAEWFKSLGTEDSPGTAVFALTGMVNCTGLIEVPMGITLREIIYDVGGGIPEGKRLKGVQTGGPLGGCLPEEHIDTPVDFDSLVAAGSVMGSGGMIVADETTCMVEFAKYFMQFVCDESCGKCPPCRTGSIRLLEVLGVFDDVLLHIVEHLSR